MKQLSIYTVLAFFFLTGNVFSSQESADVYVPSNKRIASLIKDDPYGQLIYQDLRKAQEIYKTDKSTKDDLINIENHWIKFKNSSGITAYTPQSASSVKESYPPRVSSRSTSYRPSMSLLKATTLIAIAGVTAAAANAEIVTFRQLRERYPLGPVCPEPTNSAFLPIHSCIDRGYSLDACKKGLNGLDSHTAYQFTLHPSGIVSKTIFEEGNVCYYTALSETSPVTESCFSTNENSMGLQTVQMLDTINLSDTQADLEEGVNNIVVIGSALNSIQCASFQKQRAQYSLGNPVECLLTATNSTSPITQLCRNPHYPGAITVKQVKNIELPASADGKMLSLLVTDPKKFGLDTKPASQAGVVEDAIKPRVKYLTLWNAIKGWWNQQKVEPEEQLEL